MGLGLSGAMCISGWHLGDALFFFLGGGEEGGSAALG